MKSRCGIMVAVTAAACLFLMHGAAVAVDAEAAEALARKEHCTKCHAVDKKKDGPAFKQVAAKYRNKPEGEEKLMKHVKSGEWVKLSTGEQEEHRIIKTNDEAAIRNLIQWILSL